MSNVLWRIFRLVVRAKYAYNPLWRWIHREWNPFLLPQTRKALEDEDLEATSLNLRRPTGKR